MMKRLSSKMTWWTKWAYPTFAIAFAILWFCIAIIKLPSDPVMILMATIAPILMVIFTLVFTRKFFRPLADVVWDDGDALIVRRDGLEERIPLANIVNVSYGAFNGTHRVTLLLREPSRFGERIIYLPTLGSVLQSVLRVSREPEVFSELVRRVDAARRQE